MERNDRIQIRVDEGGMEARVTLLEGPAFSIEDFQVHLAEMGQDILGEPVPAAPLEELSINHGDDIVIDEAGHLVSKRTGARTILRDGKIDVVDHHIHPGSVDLASGNLKTKGSLEVARDVTSGMTV